MSVEKVADVKIREAMQPGEFNNRRALADRRTELAVVLERACRS